MTKSYFASVPTSWQDSSKANCGNTYKGGTDMTKSYFASVPTSWQDSSEANRGNTYKGGTDMTKTDFHNHNEGKQNTVAPAKRSAQSRGWNRILLIATGCSLILTLILYIVAYQQGPIRITYEGFCVTGLSICIDRFRGLYGFLVSLIWFVSMIAARFLMKDMEHANRFYIGTLITYAATLIIFYADDLSLVYIFFEVMSICSYLWVAQQQDDNSRKVARTYLFISVTSGLVMLMGVIILYCNLHTMQLGMMKEIMATSGIDRVQIYIGAFCLLFGFATKAGAFPMHFYLHDAYKTAPAPAAAILSAALTKAGIFGILILTVDLFEKEAKWGQFLVLLGIVTMLFNAVWGIFQMNAFKILACSSVSQLGFIILGCGMINLCGEENALAIQGTILYMINHSLFKLILFLTMGVFAKETGSQLLQDMRGIGKRYKSLLLPVLTGCAGLAGLPLFSGYIAKTLLHESIVEYCHMGGNYQLVEWLFLITGGFTFSYVTKIFVTIFVDLPENVGDNFAEKNKISTRNGIKKENWWTIIAIWIPTMMSLLGGILPYQTMNRISDLEKEYYHLHQITYFSVENLKGAAISITIGVIVYLGIVRPFLNKKEILPQWMSLEKWIFEPVFGKLIPEIGAVIAKIFDGLTPIFSHMILLFMTGSAYILDWLVPYFFKWGQNILEVITKIMEQLLDWGVLLLQGTVFNSKKYIHLKASKETQEFMEEVSFTSRVIQASLSFGFLMVCFGLCATLIYLLIG